MLCLPGVAVQRNVRNNHEGAQEVDLRHVARHLCESWPGTIIHSWWRQPASELQACCSSSAQVAKRERHRNSPSYLPTVYPVLASSVLGDPKCWHRAGSEVPAPTLVPVADEEECVCGHSRTPAVRGLGAQGCGAGRGGERSPPTQAAVQHGTGRTPRMSSPGRCSYPSCYTRATRESPEGVSLCAVGRSPGSLATKQVFKTAMLATGQARAV